MRSWAVFGIICGMAQLQLFSRAELAGMRDRSRARNYSASRDEFRRAQAGRRAWGLQRRHAERLRRLREQAGCRPANLEVVRASADAGRPGMADPLAPCGGRPPREVRHPAPGCEPQVETTGPAAANTRQAGPAGKPRPEPQVETTGTARRAGPAGMPRCEPEGGPSPRPCQAGPHHGCQTAPALSREQASSRDHAPADEPVSDTTRRPPARPARPDRASEHRSGPARQTMTRHARKSATGNRESHHRNTRGQAILALRENVSNPHRNTRRYCRRIPP